MDNLWLIKSNQPILIIYNDPRHASLNLKSNLIMWVFGYGSIVWKADFPYQQKIVGYICGFDRRFYQLSTDHRGTPENPGRVVTLLPSSDSDAKVWGIGYEIKQDDIETVMNHLDDREKGGYERMEVMFYPKDTDKHGEPFEIIAYVGRSDNSHYAGETDLDTIANQVCNSSGISGSNIEYVCKLASAMREIAPDVDDDHLFNLEVKIFERTTITTSCKRILN